MLLGRFLESIREDAPKPLGATELKAGMPVVAMSGMSQLRRWGVPGALRFGVATGEGSVICRRCVKEDIETPRFLVEEMPIGDFLMPGAVLYPCAGVPEGDNSTLVRARWHVGKRSNELCSYPGDDFVAECLQGGITWEKMIEEEPCAGQHWCTPFKITMKEVGQALGEWGILQRFRDVLSWVISKIPPDELLAVSHHGIAIENGQVIHFSTCRMPEGECPQIKTDSTANFMRWCKDESIGGGPVEYEQETPEQRLTSRHRAVWIFCHAQEWDKYNLFVNNCEHFSRYCRTGRRESRQVIAKATEAFLVLLNNLPKHPIVNVVAGVIASILREYVGPDYHSWSLEEIDNRTTLQKEPLYGIHS